MSDFWGWDHFCVWELCFIFFSVVLCLYQFTLLTLTRSCHSSNKPVPHYSFLVRRVTRLKTRSVKLLDDPSCRVNGSLAQWYRLGQISMLVASTLTRDRWAKCFLDWNQRSDLQIESMATVQCTKWKFNLEVSGYSFTSRWMGFVMFTYQRHACNTECKCDVMYSCNRWPGIPLRVNYAAGFL